MVSRFARWYEERPVAGDALLAVLLLLAFVLPSDLASEGDAVVDLAFSVALLATLPFRRRAPVAVFVVVSVLCLAQFAVLDHIVAGSVVALIAVYTVVAYGPETWIRPAATACAVVGAALGAARWNERGDELSLLEIAATTVVSTLLAATLGAWRRSRRAQVAALQERNRLLALERDQQAAVGAARERTRIARELHDVVAHSLSVMVVQADGAAAGAAQRPAEAAAALRTIGDTGREALGQMRRLLGVLRAEQGEGLAPQPGAAQLEALVDQVVRAGVPARPHGGGASARADRDDRAHGLPPDAGGADERAQARRPGVTRRLVLRYGDGAVELLLRDDGRGARPGGDGQGQGLRGMRERVDVHDGTLTAGSARDGGFEVHAVLPHMSARIFLVDDQALVRAGFRMLIEAQPDMEVVGEADDGRAALEALAVTSADLVLMDVRMPNLDGVEATRRLLADRPPDRPPPKVIVLTTFDLDEYVFAAIRAGASGFLLKDSRPEELLGAVRSVLSGDAVVAPSATRRLLEHVAVALPAGGAEDPRLERLTPREREVLLEVARGRSNAEIGATLFMAEATVKTHVGRLLAKLDQRDRVQLVVFAYEAGLVRAGR